MIAFFVLHAYNLNMNIRLGTIDDTKMPAEFRAKAVYDSFAKDNTQEFIRSYHYVIDRF